MSILEGNVSGSISGSLQLNGEGGTDNYNELDNKPQINGVTLSGNKNSEDLNIIADVKVNGVSAVDADMIADITIPPAPTIPVTDVKVNNQSAMVGTIAEITIPPTPTIPVTDVKVNNQSAMVGTVAEITIPPIPTIPVEDVQVNNASVVSGGIADINIPVLDVTVDGESVVDANKVAALTTPSIPVKDVEVGGSSVVNAQGVAEIPEPNIPVQDVEYNGLSVVNAQGVAEIPAPNIPVQDVEYNGLSVVNAQGVAEIPAPGYPVTDVELNGISVLAGTIANIQPTAVDVSYDNTASGYTATQSQAAIDEAASLIADLNTNVGDFSTPLDTTAQDCHDAINELKQSLDYSTTATACTNKTGSSAIQYFKFGKVVFVNSAYDFSSLDSGWTNLGNVPTGYEPATSNLYGVNTNNSKARQYRIENNVLKVYNPSADTSTNNGGFMFIYMTS